MPRDLRKAARGQPCLVRIPGHCNGGGETTVLAHLRKAGAAGVGQKPIDLCGVLACGQPGGCHDVIDGRVKHSYSALEVDQFAFHALIRTLNYWHRKGLL